MKVIRLSKTLVGVFKPRGNVGKSAEMVSGPFSPTGHYKWEIPASDLQHTGPFTFDPSRYEMHVNFGVEGGDK